MRKQMTDDEAYAFLLKIEHGVEVNFGEWDWCWSKAFWVPRNVLTGGVELKDAAREWMREYEQRRHDLCSDAETTTRSEVD